jgi:hypothetical protein
MKNNKEHVRIKCMFTNGIQLSIRLHDKDEAWDTNPLDDWSIVGWRRLAPLCTREQISPCETTTKIRKICIIVSSVYFLLDHNEMEGRVLFFTLIKKLFISCYTGAMLQRLPLGDANKRYNYIKKENFIAVFALYICVCTTSFSHRSILHVLTYIVVTYECSKRCHLKDKYTVH